VNTTYMNAALDQLRRQGYPVRSEDVARLFPFVTRHLNVLGHYFFSLLTWAAASAPCATPTPTTRSGDRPAG
jgi:Tn3 transposase DDE domain